MEPPIIYPEQNSSNSNYFNKKKGCSCFGVIAAIIILILIGFAAYFFALPALMPNRISGDFLSAVIVPQKNGEEKIWILTDGSFNYIKTTERPGYKSTGRECIFCKTYTYIVDPKTENVQKKIKTEYNDIITIIDLVYSNNLVWGITKEYGENEPKIETYDPETAEKISSTEQFIAKFPELSSGLTEVYYDKVDNTIKLKTKDGIERIYSLTHNKLYKDYAEFNDSFEKDYTVITLPLLTSDDNSSNQRKKVMIVKGTIADLHKQSLLKEQFISIQKNVYEKDNIQVLHTLDKVFIEGIIYFKDSDCAIIIYLDKLGKKSNRLMSCIDIKTGKEKWVADENILFKKMQIDEEDDSFSSLFFTKNNIQVQRLGNTVMLSLKNVGIMGFDYETGKKLFEIKI